MESLTALSFTTKTTTTKAADDDLTSRGFNGHEMLDGLGLVHMNGRIYDPLLGRFLSADILVDGPFNLQGYNRYSYVKNNPLTYKDPSGYNAMVTGVMRPLANLQLRKQLGTEKADRAIALNDSIDRGLGQMAGGIAAGMTLPGQVVGLAEDIQDLAHPNPVVRFFAGASVAADAMTGGIAPNAGRIRRSISAGLESVSESAARVTKREAADVAGTPNVSRTEPNDIKSDGNSSNVDPEAPSSSGNADAPRSPQVGDKVTRHWGGKSGPDGESWTRDPASAQTRENLGLGRSNTGEFVSEGTLVDATGTTSKKADSWDGFGGGGDEVLVPDPQKQIRLDSVRMPDEPLPDR